MAALIDMPLDAARGCPSTAEPPAEARDVVDPSPFVRHTEAGDELELLVQGARCGGCIAKIEGGVGALPGVTAARLNLSSGKLRVAFETGVTRPAAIAERLAELGYRATPFDPAQAAADDDAVGRRLLLSLAVAGFAAANVMLLSISVWAGAGDGEMDAASKAFFHWISALVAVPAALYAGRPFFTSAWSALRARRANMDVPISLAVFLALGLSLYETFEGGGDTYFDAALTLLFFLLIGRWLDHLLRRRARAAARELLSLQATSANRIEPDGHVVAVAARDVAAGDQLMLAAGDRVPVDVVVEEGVSEADVSLATGEAAPVSVAPGDTLVSGVVNLTGRLIVRAKARAADSFLADLARLIETGEQAKTRYVRLADRAAALYVPLVHGAAALVLAGWIIVGADPKAALLNAIALLIITCPCALGLAVPAVQVVATGRLFRRGVLVKSGDALERLAAADHAVFDKTGTLTTGQLALAAPDTVAADTLETAARLARASRHPVARAIAEAAGRGPMADHVREVPGCGIDGVVDGRRARLGAAAWVGAQAGGDPTEEAWLALEDAPAVRIGLSSTVRPGAGAALEALHARGYGVEMLTGDRAGPAERVAGELGLETWRAQVSPQDKLARLKTLADEGRRVLMVGDGLNDAPALAGAHVSMSPGSAVEASQHAADFVLQGDGLDGVIEAVDVARGTRARILENFAFAALYNAVAVPLAAFGFVTPLIAALAMSGSSLVVISNALRLARGRGA